MKNTELSNTFTNVNETSNKNSSNEETTNNVKQLLEREEVKGTPFVKINNHETNKSMIVLGNYRISDEMEQGTEYEEDYMERLQSVDWNMMISIIGIITEQQLKIAELKKTVGDAELTNN